MRRVTGPHSLFELMLVDFKALSLVMYFAPQYSTHGLTLMAVCIERSTILCDVAKAASSAGEWGHWRCVYHLGVTDYLSPAVTWNSS